MTISPKPDINNVGFIEFDINEISFSRMKK